MQDFQSNVFFRIYFCVNSLCEVPHFLTKKNLVITYVLFAQLKRKESDFVIKIYCRKYNYLNKFPIFLKK